MKTRLIKEIKDANNAGRVNLTQKDMEKIDVKAGEYVEVKKLESEDAD